ncbi:LysM peptidoglycan-binding domain-containing protein [Candidatus Curtissbacteria bacterium]|nr:LysM peptidoglycan-binding domain-containing protein [Candidatus Curtissbacteria bacterium]
MAKTSTFRRFKRILKRKLKEYNLYQSYVGLILGAVVVVTLGFLAANFLTRNANQPGEIGGGEKVSAESQQDKEFKREYIVKTGDSLSAIAEKTYGRQEMWIVLAVKNKIIYPDLIYPDTTLEIPPLLEAEAAIADLTATSYDVQEGDTLFVIAQKVYADGFKWPVLARANNVGYLANGNPLIFAGNNLVIPR